MARRASSSINPMIVVWVVVGVVLVVIIGRGMMKSKGTKVEGNLLQVSELLENGNQLRGGTYTVKGMVDEKLQWTSDRGQLLSVKVETSTGDEFVAIEVPPQLDQVNLDVKQKYVFRVKFRQGGVPVATSVNRL